MRSEAQKRAKQKYEAKTVAVQIRLTSEEREAVRAKAQEQGKSLQGYIKGLILQHCVTKP